MAEYITIDQAVEAVTKTQGLRGDTLHALHKLPTIDIVTCKDCKHRGKHKLYQEVLIDNWCEIHGKIAADPDWFCADGEVE